MIKNQRFVLLLSLLAAMILLVGTIVSCGSKNNNSGSTTATQAAASSSAAKGAASLSDAVGQSADIASGVIPAQYAPGMGSGSAANTDDIANVDPRLKNVVDKMVGVLQKTGTKSAKSQAASFRSSAFKSISSAPSGSATFTAVPCDVSGTYDVAVNLSTSGTSTTWNLDMTFHDCKDITGYDIVNGHLYAAHTKDSGSNYEHAQVTANLIDTDYDVSSNITGTFALNGTFESIKSGSVGTNSALGSFTWTDPGTNGNTVYAFSFGAGGNAITDIWSKTTGATGATTTRTGNGTYSLSITAPNGSVTLAVTLTGLEHKVLQYTVGLHTDEWLNGAVNLAWTPDLSQWGCLAGTYTFTTAANTPIHTPFGIGCPTSGTLQVNNATIEYGKPSGTQVTVTIGTLSETFANCSALGNGLCKE
jgi:hypothetical protein